MAGNEPTDWTLLINMMNTSAHSRLPLLKAPRLPIIHFATRLDQTQSSDSLHTKYIMLMKSALAAIRGEQLDKDTLHSINIAKDKETYFLDAMKLPKYRARAGKLSWRSMAQYLVVL